VATNAFFEGTQPAFPHAFDTEFHVRGMEVRTWLAGLAMQALMTGGSLSGVLADDVADAAVKHADALLRRLFPEGE